MNDWILCSERLPELRQKVLVSFEDDGEEHPEGYFIEIANMIEYKNIHGAVRNYWCDEADNYMPTPTAWMPLPKPYKKG